MHQHLRQPRSIIKNNATGEVQVDGLKNPEPSPGGNSVVISNLNSHIK